MPDSILYKLNFGSQFFIGPNFLNQLPAFINKCDASLPDVFLYENWLGVCGLKNYIYRQRNKFPLLFT